MNWLQRNINIPARLNSLLLKIDWVLLLFLILFLDVKLLVKCVALIFIYIVNRNFRFGFRLRRSRIPLFYISVIIIATLNFLLYRFYVNGNYNIVFLTGITFWLFCVLAVHQVKLRVENADAQTLQNTLIVFFAINALVSFADIILIMVETGSINPYRYQGLFQKYFIGTGDFVKGIFFDTSTTNAIVNAFGVVFFLYRKRMGMVFTCMVVLLLTGSNFTNILVLGTLAGLFIFKSNRDQKSVIAICFFLLILFMAKVSPQNNDYTLATFKNVFTRQDTGAVAAPVHASINNKEEEKRKFATAYLDSLKADLEAKALAHGDVRKKPAFVFLRLTASGRPILPEADINSHEYQSNSDTTPLQRALQKYATEQPYPPFKMPDQWRFLPGKMIAMKQTTRFLFQHPACIITGSGMGNFSSKLAFRAAALDIGGGFPSKYRYINPAFGENHLALYIYYFTRRIGYHSVVNIPDSVYDQLLAEYGITGLFCFLFFYVVYFVRHIRRLTYGIPLLLMTAAVFCLGYWFEQLSIVIIFELLLFIDIKTGTPSLHVIKNQDGA